LNRDAAYTPPNVYRYFDPRDRRLPKGGNVDYHYVAYKNQQLLRLLNADLSELMPRLREWFDVQAAYLDDLLSGVMPGEVCAADAQLAGYTAEHRWSGHGAALVWHGQDAEKMFRPDTSDLVKATPELHRESIQAILARIRAEAVYWYRWLSILCEGLADEPVRMETANMRPRIRTHTVLHARQTVQDAINEFALRLVTHPDRFMGHIKQPQEYHFTRLMAPVAGSMSDERVEGVRQRSQQLYGMPDPRQVPPPEAGPEAPTPPITRRPPPPPTASEADDDEDDQQEER